MVRLAASGMVALFATAAAPSPAVADEKTAMQLGGWLGPRFFSDDSLLGYVATSPQHPDLKNGMVLGVRLARPLTRWLIPEAELPVSFTSTTPLDATVVWLDPRVHVRFEFLPEKRIRPFVLVGGGAPITLSTRRSVFATDIAGDGYFGVGTHFSSGGGFELRADLRIAIGPGVDKVVTPEFEAGIGVWWVLGPQPRRKWDWDYDDIPPEAADADSDGVTDAFDECPDRPEDEDGFEDRDGCPDIDNDFDRALDIADKCATVPETYNGFEDDDGCPDVVPADLDQVDGTIEGLTYDPGETRINRGGRRSLKRIAQTLEKYPSVKIVIIGHTDDREAAPKKKRPAGSEPPDIGQLSTTLSTKRANVVRDVLIDLGVPSGRIDVAGHGAEDSVGDNDKRRGRLANRRVEVKRFMPKI